MHGGASNSSRTGDSNPMCSSRSTLRELMLSRAAERSRTHAVQKGAQPTLVVEV